MDNANYIALNRQSGLLKELSTIANNMANASTTGFKRESAIFAEHVALLQERGGGNNLKDTMSMGRLGAHAPDLSVGSLRSTGGTFDLAIDGDGFFSVDVEGEQLLTRAGNFMTDATGRLITTDGWAVLDAAGGEIQIPQNVAKIVIAGDGTISGDGAQVARIGVYTTDPIGLERRGNNNWAAKEPLEPLNEAKVVQGYLEGSNVQPVVELARMIEVQRSYDAGQKLLDMEDSRIKDVISAIRQIT